MLYVIRMYQLIITVSIHKVVQHTRRLDTLSRDHFALVAQKQIHDLISISFLFKRLVVTGQRILPRLQSQSSSAQQRTGVFWERSLAPIIPTLAFSTGWVSDWCFKPNQNVSCRDTSAFGRQAFGRQAFGHLTTGRLFLSGG